MIDMNQVNSNNYGYNPYGAYGNQATSPTAVSTTGTTGTTTPNYANYGTQYDQSGDPTSDWYNNYGSGAYNMNDTRWAGDTSDPAVQNIKQNWWFSPNWNQANGQDWLYNPTAGFQSSDAVRNFYSGLSGPATWDQFSGNNWASTASQFPGWYSGDTSGSGSGSALTSQPGDTLGTDWAQYFQSGGVQNGTTDPTSAYDSSQLQTPWQWDQASNVANQYAMGYPTSNPQAWNDAQNVDTQMAYTGNPTTSQPWYAAMQDVIKRNTADAIKQSNEQSGLTGMRWSTPLARSNADIAAKYQEQLGAQYAQNEQAAQEAAAGRQMQGASQLQSLGQGQANLQESARDRALSASQLLSQLGGQTTNYATGLAQQLMSGGTTMANQTDTASNNVYQQFLRSLSENNPWLQQATGLGSATGTPTTYGQSTGSSLLSGLGSLASLASIAGK